MMEIALKLLILIMFLFMSEIPYIIKIVGIGIIGCIGIIDWNSEDDNDE